MRRSCLAVLFCLAAAFLCTSGAQCQVPLEYAPPITTSIQPPNPHASEPGLLFYLSGDHDFNADYAAGGNPVPNYIRDVSSLPLMA